MRKVFRRVDLVANILIIFVSLLLAVTLVQNFFSGASSQHAAPSRTESIKLGSKVSLPGYDWLSASKTLILALDVKCRFCNESTGFYRELEKISSGENVKLVAVFRGDVEESSDYLKANGISNVEVKQLPLNQLNVRGTPTLLLVDANGLISNFWVGKLPPEKETEVINALRS